MDAQLGGDIAMVSAVDIWKDTAIRVSVEIYMVFVSAKLRGIVSES